MSSLRRSFLPGLRRTLGCGLGAGIAATWMACLPQRPEGDVKRVYEDDAGIDSGFVEPDASTPVLDAGPVDPHGVAALDPPHGPFTGGNRVVIQGQGFGATPRVWFGGVEVPAADVDPISTTKVQVNVPAMAPGVVDVSVQQGADTSTSRTLPAAYTVDAFYATPPDGPTGGGTKVTLHGSGTGWAAGTTARIGSTPCAAVQIVSDVELVCTTPAGTPGSRSIGTARSDGVTQSVFDAFLYSDSDNGFRGGLSGDPLDGTLHLIVLDSYTSKPIANASVLVGDDFSTAIVAHTDATGLATITTSTAPGAPSLSAPVSVTIAKKCTQPVSFVAVPVDTITAYLDPVLTPECIPPDKGEIPPSGGKPSVGATLGGELLFGLDGEFMRGPWTIVPEPTSPSERKVTYLFTASSDPRSVFRLPDPGLGITEAAPGTAGYAFTVGAPAGNVSVYALAGLEDTATTPRTFTAYAFGVTRGVGTQPGGSVLDVSIPVNIPLDHAISLDVSPPSGSTSAPDTLVASVAISLGADGYAILPGAQRTMLLPFQGSIDIVGVPPLVDGLVGAKYIASAQVGTGPTLSTPLSVAPRYLVNNTSSPVTIDTFVRIPNATPTSASGSTWDGASFDLSPTTSGYPPDLVVIDVSSGSGTVGWRVVVPAGVTTFHLPDLRQLPGAGLTPGAVSVTVSSAKLDASFHYGELLYRDLTTRAWLAYAKNVFFVQLPPASP